MDKKEGDTKLREEGKGKNEKSYERLAGEEIEKEKKRYNIVITGLKKEDKWDNKKEKDEVAES